MGKVVYRFKDFSSSDLPVEAGAQLWTYVSPMSVSYILSSAKAKWLAGSLRYEERIRWFDSPFSFLPGLLKEENVMFSHFGKSNFAVRGIPFEISDGNSRPALQVGVNDELSSDVMSDSGIAVNYVLPKVFAEDLKEFYHNASIRHSMSILLDDALSMSNSTGSHFHLVLSEGIMEIVAVADKELLLANHYQWQTESDILYFSAAVIEMLPEQEWIPHISGMMCESELEERLIRELFPHAEVSGDTDDNLKLTPLKTFCRCAS